MLLSRFVIRVKWPFKRRANKIYLLNTYPYVGETVHFSHENELCARFDELFHMVCYVFFFGDYAIVNG